MSAPRKLNASKYSIVDLIDFLPNSDKFINFVPKRPPDIDKVVMEAEFMCSNPKEDLESAYYRCFNWVHVETANRYIGIVVSLILFIGILIDLLMLGPTLISPFLSVHFITFGLLFYGSLMKSPRFYYSHVIFNGFAAICYFLLASILIMASFIITGSESTKNKPEWIVDSYIHLWNGICMVILSILLFYSVNIGYRDFEYLTRVLESRNQFTPWQY